MLNGKHQKYFSITGFIHGQLRALAGMFFLCIVAPQAHGQTFTTNGTFTVPDGITTINAVVRGAKGGTAGANGGRVTATIAVTAGTTYNIYVGTTAGANGGGVGNPSTNNGGGASDIRTGTTLETRILVAGGGGGKAPTGVGGGTTGANGAGGTIGGKGGTQTAGGAAGGLGGGSAGATAGTLGVGGNGSIGGSGGGAGGGGYYGGGGGGSGMAGSPGSGGGGSSYADPAVCSNVVHTQGQNNGNGSVVITTTPEVSIVADPAGPINSGTSVTFTATPVNGGTPTYQWQKNGTNVGANSDTYTDATLADGDVITCVLTSSASFASPASVTSNAITISVNGALPVELVHFSGRSTQTGNQLTWTTAWEQNNRGFQVERLRAAFPDWEVLGFVAAHEKSSVYSFTDPEPLAPITYYRLRQIDHDGQEAFSNVISVHYAEQGNDLPVFPNPATHILTLETSGESEAYVICDFSGQVVQQGTIPRAGIDISALPNGSYIVKTGLKQAIFIKQ